MLATWIFRSIAASSDHVKLTCRFSGCNYRLTGVHGHVAHDVIA
ncbi:MAG: hypothetical protein VCA36_09655 [Opitutales bacterium]